MFPGVFISSIAFSPGFSNFSFSSFNLTIACIVFIFLCFVLFFSSLSSFLFYSFPWFCSFFWPILGRSGSGNFYYQDFHDSIHHTTLIFFFSIQIFRFILVSLEKDYAVQYFISLLKILRK